MFLLPIQMGLFVNMHLPRYRILEYVPRPSVILRDVYIQKYNLGETRVIHKGEDISVTLDLSKMDVPPYWQFRYVELEGGGVHNHERFELVSPEKVIMKVDKINLAIANKMYNKSSQPTTENGG